MAEARSSRDGVVGFRIQRFTPKTLPMHRLAEYMAAFSELLGRDDAISFLRLTRGSANILSRVPLTAQTTVRERVLEAREAWESGSGSAAQALQHLNTLLEQDQTSGAVTERVPGDTEGPRTLVELPGARVDPGGRLNVKRRVWSEVAGQVVKIGGRRDPVHVLLEDGTRLHPCVATRPTAIALRGFLYGGPLRVAGPGIWSFDDATGRWHLAKLTIKEFHPLTDAASIREVLADLRATGRSLASQTFESADGADEHEQPRGDAK